MGWLETYLKYTEEQECPEAFHLWAAIAILGHVLGKRVWVNRWYYRVWPCQLMVVLVSGSAVARKSTAVGMAAKFLEFLPEHLVNPLPDITSVEYFMTALERAHPDTGDPLDSVGLVLNDELGTFLSKATYAETLCSHINNLNTTTKSVFQIKFRSYQVTLTNPCVGMLAATTPTGFAEEMPSAAMTGGFMGRMLPVYQEKAKQANALVEEPKYFRSEHTFLLKHLNRISKMQGEMMQTPEAKRWYKAWYERHHHWVETHLSPEQRESGWQSRKHDHITRVAMVLSAANDSSLSLTEHHYDAALQLVDQLEQQMPGVTQDVGVRPSYGAVSQPLLRCLEKFGAQRWGDLLRRLHRHGNKDVLRPELYTLIEAGLVKVDRVDGIERYSRNWTRGEMLQRVPLNGDGMGPRPDPEDQEP